MQKTDMGEFKCPSTIFWGAGAEEKTFIMLFLGPYLINPVNIIKISSFLGHYLSSFD